MTDAGGFIAAGPSGPALSSAVSAEGLGGSAPPAAAAPHPDSDGSSKRRAHGNKSPVHQLFGAPSPSSEIFSNPTSLAPHADPLPPSLPQPVPLLSPPLSCNPDPAPQQAAPSAPTASEHGHPRTLQHPPSAVATTPSPLHIAPSTPDIEPADDALPSAQRSSPISEAQSVVADRSSVSSSPPQSPASSPSWSPSWASAEPDLAKPRPHWASTSRSLHGSSTSGCAPLGLDTQRPHPVEAAARTGHSFRASSSSDRARGQRELILPKRLSQSSSSDESRHSSPCRPPVSYKFSTARSSSAQRVVSTPVRVPPIRAFRSSSSRRSLPLDIYRPRPSVLENMADDRTLRALEGTFDYDGQQGPTADDTGDVFLRIARQEPTRGAGDNAIADTKQNSVYRAHRSMHRRPLSTAVVGFHTVSPPPLSRRLSEHRDRPRLEDVEDDQATDVSRATTYRTLARDRPASIHPADDATAGRTRAPSNSLRPSPLASRSLQVAFQDPSAEGSAYGRRRASITDGHNSAMATGRLSSHKGPAPGPSYPRAYNSSPLVRASDSRSRRSPEQAHGVEGAESTASTTSPSTVWDELDYLKSRIHRLEHTGKLPSSSGTTISRLSDERPATATTTGTTISLSPNRQAGRSTETSSNPSQKEAHHILHSALAKSRSLLNVDIYRALESAAHDAMTLSAMMGSSGQPGPISSGASAIGSGGNVTDRQLRRKADGVCRSLTELCVALGEDAATLPRSAHATPSTSTLGQLDGPVTPTMPKSLSGLPVLRRASIVAEPALPKSNSSPRALSRLEERRNSLLNGTALFTPRMSGPGSCAAGDTANVSRRSSLMVTRTRRVGTEEPEDGRNTSLLRTRRAGTEEPDEGRRTSLLTRNRRGTVGEEGDEGRFHAPSRANTDLNTMRKQGHDPPDAHMSPPDALPRSATGSSGRRFVSTGPVSSRLAAPAGGSPALPRRYLERSTTDHDAATRAGDEQGPKAPPLSHGISHLRASSLSVKRHNRDSMVSAASSATMAGGYR